jgi:CubicO group peptidase (beta-lactamase class C family)
MTGDSGRTQVRGQSCKLTGRFGVSEGWSFLPDVADPGREGRAAMPVRQRPLPTHPSLRYLKLEAKRRLAAGEFPSLHDVQGAIAREHGQPSWAALKQFISGQPEVESHALPHLEWVIARFAGAGEPGWTAPGEQELLQHFSDEVLNVFSADELVAEIVSKAPDLRGDLVVVDQAPLMVRARIADTELIAAAEESPPHRLTSILPVRLGNQVTDARAAAPSPARILGEVPAGATKVAVDAFAELGPAALVIAGGDPGIPPWAVAEGWADLERSEILDTGHLFPAPGISVLVTVTAVLCLVADGRFALDTTANDHLRTVRLADDTITIRELLSHSSGIEDIQANPAELFSASVPDLVTITGPVIGCGGPRGVVRPVNSGCAVLGQLIADVTGLPYAAAVTRLVLRPLGMSRSAFPDRADDIGLAAVTGYTVTAAGTFEPVPATVCVLQAAGGLWATVADLVRLGTGWSSLLPAALAREALTPQAAPERGGGYAGLGWLIRPRGDTAFMSGASPDGIASLTVRIGDNRTHLIMASRLVLLDSIDDWLLRLWTNPSPHSGIGAMS